MIDLCVLVFSRRGILSWFMIKIKIPWGQENSNHCGMVPTLSLKSSKGAYELVDYEGNRLARPRNGLYLKQYYA